MNIRDLTASELRNRLGRGDLAFRTGPFITRIQSRIPSVAEGIAEMYSDFLVHSPDEFVDFHVSMVRPANIRRWFHPQTIFVHDGLAPFKPLPYDQAYAMLEWGLNWCVSSHAHQYLIIHAAVIERNGRAAILPAPPGSGKSTLCAGLINRGWRLLSDELTLINQEGYIVPLARPVSLKNASIDIIKAFEPGVSITRKIRDTMKGTVAHMKPPVDAVARVSETARPAWIIFPKYQAGASSTLQQRPRSDTFMQIADNAFNYTLRGIRGFDLLGQVVSSCDCYDFTYSDLDDAVRIFAGLQTPQ